MLLFNNKILNLFISIISFNIIFSIITNSNFVNGELYEDQNILSKSILLKYYNITTNDPCSTSYFNCEKESIGSSIQFVSGFKFSKYSLNPISITEDLTVFKNASNIRIDYFFQLSDEFFLNIHKFTRLYYLYIDYQISTIPLSTIFPPNNYLSLTIGYYNGLVHHGLFTNNIFSLSIKNQLSNYSIIPSLPVSSTIKYLELPITPNHGLPMGGGNLTNLSELKLLLDGLNPASTFTFPNHINQFNSITGLSLQFFTSFHSFPFPTAIIKSLNNLLALTIVGESLVFPYGQVLDFTFTNKPMSLSFQQLDTFFSSCTQKPCIRTLPDSNIGLYSTNVSLDSIDFSNYTMIEISYHKQSPRSLLVDTINFKKIKYLLLSNSNFIGVIPDQYCQIPYEYLNLEYNQLTNVPSCFKCFGGNGLRVFPNSFIDFFSYSYPNCPTFWIDPNYKKIASTNSTTVITIRGKDLGYSAVSYNTASPILRFTEPNSEFTITIPKGVGKDILYQYIFHTFLYIPFNFVFSYEKPIINRFEFKTNGELIIIGTGFSYTSRMNLTINSLVASIPPTLDGSIIIYPPFSSLIDSFTFSLSVGGQLTEQMTYIKEFSRNVNISTMGGYESLTFPTTLPVSNINQLSLFIDGKSATIINWSGSTITVNYPQVYQGEGLYSLVLKIDGSNYINSQIRYVVPVYQVPVLISYFYVGNNDLTIKGSGFQVNSLPVKVFINNQEYSISTINSNTITIVSSSLVGITSFTFFVKVGNLISSTYQYNKQVISITPISYQEQINIQGGTLVVYGNFGSQVDNSFAILINNIECDFIQLTTTSVKINYPPQPNGFNFYPIEVYSKGNKATSQILYNYAGPPTSEF